MREPTLKVPKQIFCKMLLDSLVISKTEEKGTRPNLMFSLKSLDKFSSKYSRKLS